MRGLLKHPELPLALLTVLLIGCAGPITMNKIQHIEQGMTSNSLSSMVERKPAREFMVVDPENDLEYQVKVYPMQTDTVTTATYTKYATYYYTTPVTRNYAFLFREDALLFWGFPHEYARSDRKSVRHLAPLIMIELEKRKWR